MLRARNNTEKFIHYKYNRSDMSMLELTPDFIRDFAVYLSTVKGKRNATIWLNCIWLKGVVMRAYFNGKIPRNPFAQFYVSPNTKECEFFTEDELKKLMAHEFADSHSAFVRDLFVFVSFTALSFVDLKELTTDEIVEMNGEKWILAKRHKTHIPYQVKLLDFPLQIIERYRPFQKDNSIFGDINYWTTCKRLKKVICECDITKDISFHCTRHGFAILALSKGIPIESVSRVLGHTNIVTTQLYANITPGDIDDRKPLEYKAFINFIYGKLVGTKGYISKNLFQRLLVDGIQLITKLKSNMKGALMNVSDRPLIRKRVIIETVNDELKNIAQVKHS